MSDVTTPIQSGTILRDEYSNDMLFAVPLSVALEFKKSVLSDASDVMTSFKGKFPDGALFSLAFEGHAASWIRKLYNAKTVDHILTNFGFRNKREDGSWGEEWRAKPRILDVEIFPYEHAQKPAEGLIVHYGVDKTADDGDIAAVKIALEDVRVQGKLMEMHARWLLVPDGVIDLSPRAFAPVSAQSFRIDF